MPGLSVAPPFEVGGSLRMLPALALRAMRGLRLALAPPGTWRETMLRRAYVPIIRALPRRWQGKVLATRGFRLDLVRIEAAAPHDPVERLLVLKLDHIGDFVIGLPALRALRDGFPNAHLTLVCAHWNEDWALRLGWIDSVIAFDFFTEMNRDWQGPSRASYDAIAARVTGEYDLAVDLRHDGDTRPCLYRLNARRRAGFAAPPEPGLPYLDLMLPQTEGMSVAGAGEMSMPAEARLELLAAAVVGSYAPRPAHPIARLPRRRPSPATPVVGTPPIPNRPYAVLAIGAGDPIRCWPIVRYGELGRALIATHDLDIVVIGGHADAADAEALSALLPPGRVRTALGVPLTDLPDLLAMAQLCVCNGSGISHLAASLGVATIALLSGTTRMDVWRPAGVRAVALGGRTPCQPCGLKRAEDCPWQVACLMAVTPAMVLETAGAMLTRR